MTLTLLLAALVSSTPGPTDPVTLAIVIGSNRSASLDRPPLQYADDDAAKYYTLFASLTGEDDIALLTQMDRDTARLFPALARLASPPTRPSLDQAVQRLARIAERARAAGHAVRLYFVFAGHGDVDAGRGFLELADGPFTSDDLDALLHRIGAAESHVILDSCNSFFVVNPRKPGGRRFATPRDAAETLARRLPDVGVFLSTSSEAEVYEWSELQSGVFSHAVRSGLMGAADANHDGVVTYQELAAFVETATGEIRNPLFRPKVFARGPNGDDGRALLDLSRAPVVLRSSEPGPVRLAVRDQDGLRWLDAHKEAGQVLELRLPSTMAGHLEVERLRTSGPEAGSVEARYALPRTGPSTLESLAATPAAADGRGAADVFRGLFARPFGSQALAVWIEERARAPEPVYGLSRADAARLALLLGQLAASERERRHMSAVFAGTYALAGASYFGLSAADGSLPRDDRIQHLISASVFTGVGVGGTLFFTLRESRRERTFERYRLALSLPGADQVAVAAEFDEELHRIAADERSDRRHQILAGWGLFGVAAAAVVANELDHSHRKSPSDRLVSRGSGVAIAGLTLGLALQAQFSTSRTQRLIELWEADPSRRPLELGVTPLRGGVMLTMGAAF